MIRSPSRLLSHACIAAAAISTAVGCRPVETRFEILGFSQATTAERLAERFAPGAFAEDAHRNLTFVFRLEDAGPGEATTQPDAGPVPPTEQIVLIDMFWQPRPGSTFAESTQTNASITYCLKRGVDAIAYDGAGFVYLTRQGDDRIDGRIESASLAPMRSIGHPRDLFGRCQLQGTFTAYPDKRRVVDATIQLRRLFGPSSTRPPSSTDRPSSGGD